MSNASGEIWLIEWRFRLTGTPNLALRHLRAQGLEDARSRLGALGITPWGDELRLTIGRGEPFYVRHREFIRRAASIRTFDKSAWRQADLQARRRAHLLTAVDTSLADGYRSGAIDMEVWHLVRNLLIDLTAIEHRC